MAKVRVHELAKELGVESKELLAHLKEQGEFVKSASSTIEAPVVRKIRENPPAAAKKADGDDPAKSTTRAAAKPAPAKKAATKKKAPAKRTTSKKPATRKAP